MPSAPPAPEPGRAAPSPPGPPAPPGEGTLSRPSAYLALTKPGITGLILLMAVAGFFAGDPTYPADWLRLGELLLAGALASGGAAALNHWYDRDLDLLMRRTRFRPLPSDRLSPREVLSFGLALTAAGWALAAWWLPLLSFLALASGTLVYVGVYTIWLKRRTRWNIVIGGYAGSAPVLAGCAAAVGSFNPAGILLAVLVFLWTPPHFWSLSLALRDDYERAQLPMLPAPGELLRSGRITFYSGALLLLPTVAFGLLFRDYAIFLALSLALGLWFTYRLAGLLRSVERSVALRGFIFSGLYLTGVAVAMAVNWFVYRFPGL